MPNSLLRHLGLIAAILIIGGLAIFVLFGPLILSYWQ